MDTKAVAWIHLSDTSTVFSLHLDSDGDGIADQEFVPVVGVPSGDGLVDAGFALRPLQPNPARHEATIQFHLPGSGTIDLAVYDAAGRRVASLVRGPRAAGPQSVVWRFGREWEVPRGGLYFVRLLTPWGTRTERIVLL
jgi:hypothetical protein